MKHLLLTMLALLLALSLPLAVAAQEQKRPDAAEVSGSAPAPEAPAAAELATVPVQDSALPPESGAATELDEIVVTAQKTKQPLHKVPVSVTAIGGDFIQDTGSVDLSDVSLYIPNVRVDADDLGSPQVFIRGFGTNSFNPSFESSVGFLQDELYFGRPGYFTEAMFDVDRVEVLRGPQGTLFGKNTVAGLFNVISRGVDSEYSADGRYFYGETNEHRFEGGVGGMFNDWLGGRVAVLYRQQDGELQNQFLQRAEDSLEQQAARVKLKVNLLSGVDSELTVVSSNTEAPFWPFQLMKLDQDTRDYLEGFDPKIEDDPYDFVTSFETLGFIEKGSDTAGLKTEWALGDLGPFADFTPVLVLGVSRFHIDQLNELDVSPADIARLDNHEDHEQVSVELRLSASADSLFGMGTGLEFVAGGFYFDSSYTLLARVLAGRDLASYIETQDFCQLATADPENPEFGQAPCDSIVPGPNAGAPAFGQVGAPVTDGDHYRFDYVQDIRATALFGQFTWNLSERWAITPGLRLNMEEKRVDTAGNGYCQAKDGGAGQGSCAMEQLLQTQDYNLRDLRREETDLSPKLALQYFAPYDVNYYASYARGYKSGGFNSISFTGVDLEYQPEEARTTELGFKARLFDRKFSTNVTVYQTDFDNLQVLAFNGVFFDVSNAGQAKSSGAELDFQWITPFEPLRIMGSAGLLDAKYVKYDGAPAPIRDQNGELQIGATQSLAGQRMAFAPRQTATLTPTLTYLFGDFIGTLAVDVLYQGEQFTDTDLDPNTRQAAYTKYAARLMFGSVAGAWTLSLGGTNLTDERILNQVTDAVFFPGTYFAQQAGGRQLFAVVSLQM